MFHIRRMAVLTVLALSLAGCGSSDEGDTGGNNATGTTTTPNAVGDTSGPKEAVTVFLEACRTGNDATATAMLSSVAREKWAELKRTPRPKASDTARFEIGDVTYQDPKTALVSCAWTDLGTDGQPSTDLAQWAVRQESAGWRVAGVACTVFEDEPPVLLDFEKPEEMERKQQQLRQMMIARVQQDAQRQATAPKNPQKPQLR